MRCFHIVNCALHTPLRQPLRLTAGVGRTHTGRIRSDDAAPSLTDQPAPGLNSSRGRLPKQLPPSPQGGSPSIFKILYKRTLRRLSSLPLAIAEMFVIAGLSAVGTVIEQNKPIQYYIDNYPDGDQQVSEHLLLHPNCFRHAICAFKGLRPGGHAVDVLLPSTSDPL